ncbi:phosphoglycerate kinase [Candidatus Micrarchaeota archaeon CG1_02_47_40]|nr:MAG: phosphoglycerate kinase [Candidatus Micrarchaeota archaeon CG1_02_47_40]
MKTLSDFDFRGKRTFVRVDINSPFDEKTGKIEKSPRVSAHAKTLRELADKGARVIVLAHQGRKGDADCVSLKAHAGYLEKEIGKPVLFINDVCGERAKKAINGLREGEILLLENVRFLEDEKEITSLLPLCDVFVMDGFSVSHRAQASVVGFSSKPAFAGRVMQEEMEALGKVKHPSHPCVFILGGAKPEDSLAMMGHWLKEGKMDYALCGGVLGSMFLLASGTSIGAGEKYLKEKGYTALLPKAKELLVKYNKKIQMPIDVAYAEKGKRKECPAGKLPASASIGDIGKKTLAEWKGILKNARTVVINGPVGIYEEKSFEAGTREILKAIAASTSFSLAGGGHTISAIDKFGIGKAKISYISTAGKALIAFLSGEKLPGVEML